MFRTFIRVSSCLLFLLTIASADSGHDDSDILLQLKNGVNIQTILQRYPGTDLEEEFSLQKTYLLKVGDPADLEATVAAMEDDPDLVWVSLNYFGETPEGVRRTLAVTDTTPTPSEYHDQGAVVRMQMNEAHEISKGAGVIVAVIDTGVDYNHPDLRDHILRDGHGDVIGMDFVDDDEDPMEEADGLDDDGDCPNVNCIDEGFGHGTHVAGIIALLAPDAKILPIRVLNSDGVGTSDHVAEAIDFALDFTSSNGKVVINLSLGLPEFSPFIYDQLQEAKKDDVPVIASGGNNNNEAIHYPATDPDEGLVISVAATNPNDIKANFSNFNAVFDVSAPGVGIYSTFPAGKFATWDGTSMAAPFVTAEVALMKALDDEDEQKSTDEIEELVEAAVDSIDALNPDFVGKIGSGRINLRKSVEFIRNEELQVKKAIYRTRRAKLILQIRSSAAPDAELTVSEGLTILGLMEFSPDKHFYIFKMKGISEPNGPLTITSSAGGTVLADVIIKD